MRADDKPDPYYWPKWVAASVAVAVGTALATEGAKLVAEKLRERWGLKTGEHE